MALSETVEHVTVSDSKLCYQRTLSGDPSISQANTRLRGLVTVFHNDFLLDVNSARHNNLHDFH